MAETVGYIPEWNKPKKETEEPVSFSSEDTKEEVSIEEDTKEEVSIEEDTKKKKTNKK